MESGREDFTKQVPTHKDIERNEEEIRLIRLLLPNRNVFSIPIPSKK